MSPSNSAFCCLAILFRIDFSELIQLEEPISALHSKTRQLMALTSLLLAEIVKSIQHCLVLVRQDALCPRP